MLSKAETVFRALLVGSAILMLTIQGRAQTSSAPLHLETKISLGAVAGRIDHLAIDLKRRRLFVAELGNDSIGVVDLAANRVQSTMPGLKEPQGIAYEPSTDTVYVANGGGGSVRIFRARGFMVIRRVELRDGAGNILVDPPPNPGHVWCRQGG